MEASFTLVSGTYGDPRLRTPGLNPYQRYPERSSWTEREIRRYPDGSEHHFSRECMRWAGELAYGTWTEA